jgi:hypothetical protein
MGRFIYDTLNNSIDIEDRTLAHLRIVIMNKLRRSESFMFTVDLDSEGISRRSFWMHPSVPLQFAFHGSREPRLNRLWIEALMVSASSPNGLFVVPEPQEEKALDS